MNQNNIKQYLSGYMPRRERTIVIVDFGNVEKWKHNLGWRVGIRELAAFVKNFSFGQKFLRRFYYGADYGQKEKSIDLVPWSKNILRTADLNGFNVVDKRVKYIHSTDNIYGFEKKCDLDVEMVVDLIRERDNYDTVVLFSGDGDLVTAIQYLKEEYKKQAIIMGARGHIGREVIDAKRDGIIEEILYADDFEYRLNMDRFQRR
ncbi:MAG: NYN domain-containing protein [Parcubacteria group bacterium]|nr:NYN domain-containing protein [Parcubacteria group bacterium]